MLVFRVRLIQRFLTGMVLLSASGLVLRWSATTTSSQSGRYRILVVVRALSTTSSSSSSSSSEASKKRQRTIQASSSSDEIFHHLQNPSLLLPSSRVVWTNSNKCNIDDSTFFPVHNPANPDSVLAHVRIETAETARECVERSYEALPAWRDGTTALERANL